MGDELTAEHHAAREAAAAAPGVRTAGGAAVDAALRTAADLLRDRAAELLAANGADVAAAEQGGMDPGLLDRLRLAWQVLKARSAAVLRTGSAAFGSARNTTTRLLDGDKLLGLPKIGINVDHTPGPRGPVTYPDLSLRQFVVLRPE